MIEKVYAVFFSPAGSTGEVTKYIAGRIADDLGIACEVIDFTLPGARKEKYVFKGTDLVVMGTPTYAGRIPNKALPFVQTLFEGNGAPAISLVTYGNRSFDSSLTELVEEMSADGFKVFAAGAWVCRHVFTDQLAPGRPDAEDFAAMNEFAGEAVRRIAANQDGSIAGSGQWKKPVIRGGEPVAPYYVPKGEDGRPTKFLKAKPVTDTAKCTNCGICARVCPMGSVSMEDYAQVPGICIKCQACVLKCPEGAKYWEDEAFLSHVRMLEKNFRERREPEWY